MRRGSIERLDSIEPSTEFFVGVHTSVDDDGAVHTAFVESADHYQLRRTVTIGAPDYGQVDFLDAVSPQIDLRLLSKRLLLYVATTVLFVGGFTVFFYHGLVVKTVYEKIGTSKQAEEIVETYNTYSGYVMALVEVFVGIHTAKFLPVLQVYLHNTLYFLRGSTTITPRSSTQHDDRVVKGRLSRGCHSTILFIFPLFLALTMGNSLRGLQAGQSSAGLKHIMSGDDLKKDQPLLDLLKAKASSSSTNDTAANSTDTVGGFKVRGLGDIVLKNAIRGRTTPFTFNTKSPCGESAGGSVDPFKSARVAQLNVHDLDASSAVFGFAPQEWNGEALVTELKPKTEYKVTIQGYLDGKAQPPTTFSLGTALEIFVQGKILLERAQGEATVDRYPCSLSDERTDLDFPDPEEPDVGSSGSANGINTPGGTNTNTRAAKTVKHSSSSGKNRKKKTMMMKPGVVAKLASGVKAMAKRRSLQESTTSDDGSLEEDDEWTYEPDNSLNQWVKDDQGVRQCEGAVSSLLSMIGYMDPEAHTLDVLVGAVVSSLNTTFRNISIEDTEISLETYDVTPQMRLEVVKIDVVVDASVNYGLSACTDEPGCDTVYRYADLAESFCGSTGCAFIDESRTFTLPREIGVVPFVTNCTLDGSSVQYSADFRGYYPTDCKPVANTALLYGIGSYITGDEYGDQDSEYGAPFITSPRRHMRFTFAKATWQTEDVSKKFKADCGRGADCLGLWYQLQPSGRFLFAGKQALPTNKLAQADFRTPIPLVQLNSPTLYVEKYDTMVTLERLEPTYFTNATSWSKGKKLSGDQCSMLIDSYLAQIEANNYFLERPLQAMYTSFFYFMMEQAAVTQLNDTALAANGSFTNVDVLLAKQDGDRLGNVKLKGDKQVRSIKVQVPISSFYTTLGGCAFVFVVMVAVLALPSRRVQHFEDNTPPAQQFVVMRRVGEYPEFVHRKTLFFQGTSEIVPFDEMEIESMTLVHEKERDRVVYL